MLLADPGAGASDFAICRTTVAANRDIFGREEFGEERVSFVAAPRSPLINRHHLSEITACRWVLFPSHMPIRRLLERELMEYGLESPPCSIEVSPTFATVLMLNEDPGAHRYGFPWNSGIFCSEGAAYHPADRDQVPHRTYELVTRKDYTLRA